jgi:MFS family permease
LSLSRQQRRNSLAGVIAAMAVVNLVYGITFPLLALVLDSQGVSKTLIGLNTISQAVAILLIAPLAPRLLSRFSPAGLMQTAAAVLAVLMILAGLFPNVYFWFPLRFLIGGFTAMLWIASEALINGIAQERSRGRVIGLYTSIGAAGFALGPLLLILTGTSGMLPFYSTSILLLLAAIPLFLVSEYQRSVGDEEKKGVWAVFLMAPIVMLINFVYAAGAESMITFFPLFGMHLGLSEEFALGLMTLMGFGGMILVLPMGWLADRVNRMGLLVACLVVTMAGLLIMPWILQQAALAAPFVFVFGGVEGMIYALGVILIGQEFRGGLLAAASTAYTACWAVGNVVGPMLVGAGMDRLGADSMGLMIFLIFAAFLPFPLISWIRGGAAGKALR